MKTSIALLALVILLLVIVPVYAQESTAAVPTAEVTSIVIAQPAAETHPVAGVADSDESQADFSGATTLVLLVGLGTVLLVGFGTLMRQNYKAPQE